MPDQIVPDNPAADRWATGRRLADAVRAGKLTREQRYVLAEVLDYIAYADAQPEAEAHEDARMDRSVSWTNTRKRYLDLLKVSGEPS